MAVKLLNQTIIDGYAALTADMASFHHELSILSRLSHANIVRVYGGCMRPPNVFLVMQLMEGSLDSIIHRSNSSLGLKRALCLARDVAAGLAYLGSNAIVHRGECEVFADLLWFTCHA